MAEKIDQNYFVKQGESAEAYNKRIADYNASKEGGSKKTPAVTSDPFIDQLKKSLLDQQGVISSKNSKIEDSINDAIKGVKSSAESGAAAVETKYNRLQGYAVDEGERAETNFLEQRSGFATPVVAFRNLQEYNKKAINDLEQRKQELILEGNSAAAGQIAGLQLKKLEFEDKAAQQTFSNLLQMGSLAVTMNAQKQQADQFERTASFAENQAMSAIALKYGVAVQPGDTIDTITARAAPFASEVQKTELLRTKTEIAKLNAEIAKAARGDSGSAPGGGFDQATIASIAAMGAKNPAFLANLNPSVYAAVVAEMEVQSRPRAFSFSELQNNAFEEKQKGTDYNTAKAAIASNPTIANKAQAYEALDRAYKAPAAARSSGSPLDSLSNWFATTVLREPAVRY